MAQAFIEGEDGAVEATSAVLVPDGSVWFHTTLTKQGTPPVAAIFFRDIAGVRW